jgi:hypothetical protein
LWVDNAQLDTDLRLADCVHLAADLVLGAVILGVQGGCDRRQLGHAIPLGETGTRKCRTCPVEQRRGHRRGAVANTSQRTQVKRGQCRAGITGVEQHLNHRRRKKDFVDLLSGDSLKRDLGRESWQYHMQTTTDRQCCHPGVVGQMKHRHNVQEHRVVAIDARSDHSH